MAMTKREYPKFYICTLLFCLELERILSFFDSLGETKVRLSM